MSLWDKLFGGKDVTLDYQKKLEGKVDAFIENHFKGRRPVVGAKSIMKVRLMRTMIRIFDTANELVKLDEGGKVYVAYPYNMDIQDEDWPWLTMIPCLTDGAYFGVLKKFRDIIADLRRDSLMGDVSASVLILVIPKELDKRTRIHCAKARKEYELGTFGMPVHIIEV